MMAYIKRDYISLITKHSREWWSRAGQPRQLCCMVAISGSEAASGSNQAPPSGWGKEPGEHTHPFGESYVEETSSSQAQNLLTWSQHAASEAQNTASS